IRECAVATARAGDVLPSHRQRLGELAGRISEPATLNQLLDVLEDTALKPPQQDLVTLMSQLRPDALRALIARLVKSRNPELRALLESVVTRIASANTDELMRLIGVEDESVSLEAMRRAGDIGSPAAVGPLAAVLDAPSDASRGAAVAALAQIGSPGAMQALEGALDDADRDIRLAAVKACAQRQHRGALQRLEHAIRDRLLHDGSTAEKNAFFDAYATLGGEASVPLLESILLPRGILARKQDPATRASAAMALGRLGTPRALDAVRTAAGDREIVVRSAAARALRGGGTPP
ncbi:MAG: HEAT repeat domain-containing protein, partial [Gemmatimonadaceae bacterium]